MQIKNPFDVERRIAMQALAVSCVAPATVFPASQAHASQIRNEAPSQKLCDLIAEHKRADEAFVATLADADAVWPEECPVYNRTCDAEDRALRAIVHYRCRTPADRIAKAEYLMARVDTYGNGTLGMDEDFGLYSLLRAMREEARADLARS